MTVNLSWLGERKTLIALFLLIFVVMLVVYALVTKLSFADTPSEANVLATNLQQIRQQSQVLYAEQRNRAQTLAASPTLQTALQARDTSAIQAEFRQFLETYLDFDSLVLLDAEGVELAYLRTRGASLEFNATPLHWDYPFIAPVLAGTQPEATAFVLLDETVTLTLALPLQADNARLGLVLLGRSGVQVLEQLHVTSLTQLALYNVDGRLLAHRFTSETELINSLAPEILSTLETPEALYSQSLNLDNRPYRWAVERLVYGETELGFLGVLIPENLTSLASLAQQAFALLMSLLAGFILAAIAFMVYAPRMALRSPQATPKPLPIAPSVSSQGRADNLETLFRRQRREQRYCISLLEGFQQAVLVLEKTGRVIFINQACRVLFPHLLEFQSLATDLTGKIPEVLGESLGSGLYVLGSPQRILLGERQFQLEAARLLSSSALKVGTILLLKDVTEEKRKADLRRELLGDLPADLLDKPFRLLPEFAQQLGRNLLGLQKLLIDLHEVLAYDQRKWEAAQAPVRLETLLITLINDWRQLAQSADVTLRLDVQHKGQVIQADESRLRWALGNIIENSITYTLPQGSISLDLLAPQNGRTMIRIRDNGVGIQEQDLARIPLALYRGQALNPTGEVLQNDGLGLGLVLAQQIIVAHGGSMKIRSKQGVGTVVDLSLPLSRSPQSSLSLFEDDLMEGATMPMNLDISESRPS